MPVYWHLLEEIEYSFASDIWIMYVLNGLIFFPLRREVQGIDTVRNYLKHFPLHLTVLSVEISIN